MDGYLLIDKASGFTSFDVIAKLRGILKMKKLGHTGTLDPNATGLLVVLCGSGTKAVPLLEHHTKTYEAELLLGRATDTGDIWGEVTEEKTLPSNLSEKEVEEIILSFLGYQMQTPPMYSAKKMNGQKLYDLARQGKTVERKPVSIHISELVITKMDLPRVEFTVTCSAGTYIRTLCTDIGEKLGLPACMSALRRTRVGAFRIEDALTLEKIQELRELDHLDEAICPIDQLFTEYAALKTTEKSDRFLQNGACIEEGEYLRLDSLGDTEKYRMYFSNGSFAGLYHRVSGKGLIPFKMMLTNQ